MLTQTAQMRAILAATLTCVGYLSWHLADAAGNAKAGKMIFDNYCKDCHVTGERGAPKVGDKAAWAARIKKGELILTEHAFYGHRKMPMFGDCSACNLVDFADAVAYMVSKSK
jgi:cytochrome c5